jgi:putative NADH-flavin reductase
VRIAVTGAFGFSGKYIAQRLLALRHEVITLTNSPQRANPFGGSIKAFPYNFSEPHELEESLRGIDVLINTYGYGSTIRRILLLRRHSPTRKLCSTLPSAQASVASCTSALLILIANRVFPTSAARRN